MSTKPITSSCKAEIISIYLISILLFLNLDAYSYINNTVFSQEYAYFLSFGPFLGLIIGHLINKPYFSKGIITPVSSVAYSVVCFVAALFLYKFIDLSQKINVALYFLTLFFAYSLLSYRFFSELKKNLIALKLLLCIILFGAGTVSLLSPYLYDLFAGPVWVIIVFDSLILVCYLLLENELNISFPTSMYFVLLGLLLTLTNFNVNSYVSWNLQTDKIKLLPSINGKKLIVEETQWDRDSRDDYLTIELANKTKSQWLFKNGDSYGPIKDISSLSNSPLINYPLAVYPAMSESIESALMVNLPIVSGVLHKRNISTRNIHLSQVTNFQDNNTLYDLVEINIGHPGRQEWIGGYLNSSYSLNKGSVESLYKKLTDKGKIVFLTNNQAYIVKAILLLMNACEQDSSCRKIKNGVTILQLKPEFVSHGNPFVYLLSYDKRHPKDSIDSLFSGINKNIVNEIYTGRFSGSSFYNSLLDKTNAEEASKWLSINVFEKSKRANVNVASEENPDFYLLNTIPGKFIKLLLSAIVLYVLLYLIFIPLKRDADLQTFHLPLPMAQIPYILNGLLISLSLVFFVNTTGAYSSIPEHNFNAGIFYFIASIFGLLPVFYTKKLMYVATLILVLLFVMIKSDAGATYSLALYIASLMLLPVISGSVISCTLNSYAAIDDETLLNYILTGFLLGFVVTQYLFKTSNTHNTLAIVVGVAVLIATFTVVLNILVRNNLHSSDVCN